MRKLQFSGAFNFIVSFYSILYCLNLCLLSMLKEEKNILLQIAHKVLG
jgi:hypothetical protein